MVYRKLLHRLVTLSYLKNEHWQDAIERSLKTMGDWADKEGVQIQQLLYWC